MYRGKNIINLKHDEVSSATVMGNIQYCLSTVLDISPFNPGLKRLSVSESWETFNTL